jgi:hypothetical protein
MSNNIKLNQLSQTPNDPESDREAMIEAAKVWWAKEFDIPIENVPNDGRVDVAADFHLSQTAPLRAERDELVKMLEIAIEVSSNNWSILRQNGGQRKWYYLTNDVGTDGGFDSALEAYRALTENKEQKILD